MEKDTSKLPHNPEAEQAVLSSLMQDNNLISEARDALSVEHFYDGQNMIIYNAIIELNKDKKPVDIVILSDHLKHKDISVVQLMKIVDAIPTSANFSHYADILKGYYARRLVIKESYNFIAQATTSDDYSELLSSASRRLSTLAQQQIRTSIITPIELVKSGQKDFENRRNNQTGFTGLSSGLIHLDELCGGFGGGDLVIVAGQTGMGKSSLLLDIAYKQCINTKQGCAYFSLEMAREAIFYRMISKISNVQLTRIRTPRCLSSGEIVKFNQSVAELRESRFFLDTTSSINLNKIVTLTKKIKAKQGIDFICVDYIQLVNSGSKGQARHEVLSDIAKELKQMARELEIPVLAGAQLNRSAKEEAGLNHIGESYAIVQHADTAIIITRDDTNVTLNVAKARHGRGGKFDLQFDYNTVSFVEGKVRP